MSNAELTRNAVHVLPEGALEAKPSSVDPSGSSSVST